MKLSIKTIYVLTITLLVSCNKENIIEYNEELRVCSIKDPIKNIAWLNKEFKQFQGGPDINGIILYMYDDREIIEVQNSIFSSTNQHQYYCDGTKINLNDPELYSKFREERIKIGTLYGSNIWHN